jgi:beta-phosphoglucomutase
LKKHILKQTDLKVIEACIFDLDGVIVDTAHYHYLAWKRLADELKIPFSTADNERLKGVSRLASLQIILDLGKTTLDDQEKMALTERKNAWFVDYIQEIKPHDIFPGVRELIGSLRKVGLKTALASSSKNAPQVVSALSVAELFDVIVDGSMVIHSKPDPEIFLLAAAHLNIAPECCLVFEDAGAGIEAARRANMKCIGVGDAMQLGEADLVYKNAADFNLANLQML